MKLLMSAAHGGYGSEKVPLGGGAAVFERLAREWSDHPELELHLVGPGPAPPSLGKSRYHRVELLEQAPSALDEFRYARFCREFEQACTQLAIELGVDAVLAHDLSEGPDFGRLAAHGIVSHVIFHVDVVDFFQRIYLGALFKPETLTRWFRGPGGRFLPDILKLVFEKQQIAVDHCSSLVVPSDPMREVLTRCYPNADEKVRVVPWGAPHPEFDDNDVQARAREIRAQLQLAPEQPLLMTLSRISPEKGQDRLLEALQQGMRRGELPSRLTLAIAGKAAFMRGNRYRRRLLRLAAAIGVRVVFPGHLGGLEKRAWLRATDLFVVASTHESYGLTTLEAMQQQCPVVAVESYGTAATVDSEVGRLVPQGPQLPLRLWCTLRDALHHPQRSNWEQNALARARKREPAQVAQQLLELMRQ